MSKEKILVIDSDEDIRNLLQLYFTKQGYEVTCVADNESGLNLIKKHLLPTLILLEVNMDEFYLNMGYDLLKGHRSEPSSIKLDKNRLSTNDFCTELRTNPRTYHIPIMFLRQPDELGGRWIDIEIGADDSINKPLDIEELKLRVQNLIKNRYSYQDIDFISGRPKERSANHYLRQLKQENRGWVYFNITIQNFEAYCDVYSTQYGDDVIRALSLIVALVIDNVGTDNDFIGHLQRDNFVLITHTEDLGAFKHSLIDRFNTEIQQHYSFLDRERGYIKDGDKRFPLMSLAITETPHTYFGEQWDGTLPKQGDGDE